MRCAVSGRGWLLKCKCNVLLPAGGNNLTCVCDENVNVVKKEKRLIGCSDTIILSEENTSIQTLQTDEPGHLLIPLTVNILVFSSAQKDYYYIFISLCGGGFKGKPC